MAEKNTLFKISDLNRNDMPFFYDYGKIISSIQEKLAEVCGFHFDLYSDEDTSNEIWEILEEDVKKSAKEVQFITYIYNEAEIKTISSRHTEKAMELIIKPRIENGIYFYPHFEVALSRVRIYQVDGDSDQDLIFAKNDACLRSFLQYVLKRKREYIKNYVTVFTDTDDGVETEIENINSLVSREDVFLDDSIKKEIYRSIDQFFSESGEFFKTYDIPYKRGILLYGKPGNGKTTLVKSIASSIEAPVAYWQITEFTSSYTIKEVFSSVLKLSPMVLVIEDIDSMPSSVRSVFLNILDGATSREGIFLIGTTNYPEKIDPGLMNRSGRFDRAYEIKGPDKNLRHQYLMKKKINRILSEEEIREVVSATDQFSIAQLNELYTSIALEWHYDLKVDITRICSELKSVQLKQQKQNWEEKVNSSMGFSRFTE
ncbi:MAG: ATP-binding protein [Bacillota bacterium]|nr:ATP-binding protein [Bacillota bacterium]